MNDRTTPAAKFVGTSDPETTLRILWQEDAGTARGRKPRLSPELVGAQALALADAEGLAGLSMRALGARLGVAAMALYRYVPNKDVLLELALEAAYAELPHGLSSKADWQVRLRTVAEDAWTLYLRHPWMLQVSIQRPSLGPHALRKYERELGAVEGAGFSDVEMDLVVCALNDFVRGSARSAVEAAAATATTGVTDDEWWSAHHAVLERLVSPSQFPLATRVGSAAAGDYNGPSDPGKSFAFGLERLIDGFAMHLGSRGAGR